MDANILCLCAPLESVSPTLAPFYLSFSPMSTPASLPPNPSLNPPRYIYRIVTEEEWTNTFEKEGKYTGSPLDKKDGFIHISDKEAVRKKEAGEKFI